MSVPLGVALRSERVARGRRRLQLVLCALHHRAQRLCATTLGRELLAERLGPLLEHVRVHGLLSHARVSLLERAAENRICVAAATWPPTSASCVGDVTAVRLH